MDLLKAEWFTTENQPGNGLAEKTLPVLADDVVLVAPDKAIVHLIRPGGKTPRLAERAAAHRAAGPDAAARVGLSNLNYFQWASRKNPCPDPLISPETLLPSLSFRAGSGRKRSWIRFPWIALLCRVFFEN